MARGTSLIVGLGLLLIPTVCLAGNVGLKLCTGSAKGNYYAAGQEVARQVARDDIAVELVETGGSMDNMQKMADGDCDAGFAQVDAYLRYQAVNQGSRLEVEWPRQLYDEYVHLVCRRDTGVESIKDLAGRSKSFSLMVGAPGSGSAITWDSFTRLSPDYLDVETHEADGNEALQSINEAKASCLMFVSGLRSKYASQVNNSGASLRLVSVDDRDFKKAKHIGKPIYDFQDIPKETYRKLQSPSGDSIETLTVRAAMIISSAWAREHAVPFEALTEGIKRATPIIRERVAAD